MESYEYLNYQTKDKCIDNLQNSSQLQDNPVDHKKEIIKESINSICKYQKSYVKNSLSNLLEKSPKNAEIICKYIITEQNEINMKELTKEGKIKTLIGRIGLHYKERQTLKLFSRFVFIG